KSTTAKAVVSASRSFPGNLVCASGSRTGEVCNLRVTDTIVSYQASDGVVRGPVVIAVSESGKAAIGPGDSGGPVYQPLPDSEHFKDVVEAKGIISGAEVTYDSSHCADPAQVWCGAEIYYVDIIDALWVYDAQLQLWSPY
ncbi:hypothetical protein ABT301_37875, partial [Streptomyces sp. NPDC000987]